jgi:hypothetical protein
MSFPFIHQPDAMDCGPACLCMIAEHYGKQYALEHLRDNCFIGREGVSMLGISKAAEKIGFHTVGGRLTFDKLAEKALLPCLTHVRKLLMETTGVCSLYLVLHPSSMTLNSNERKIFPVLKFECLNFKLNIRNPAVLVRLVRQILDVC